MSAPTTGLDLQEKLAHIDRMLADHDRRGREIHLVPRGAGAVVIGGACGLFVAAGVFVALILKLVGS